MPEISSGIIDSAPCAAGTKCPPPYDNNVDNLGPIVDFKAQNTRAWASAGLPVILSVSNGFDDRVVWAKYGTGIWGDNHDYTDDRFRNWLSEMKGPGIEGITFDTWNGYTEGYAAVVSAEHGDTVYNWLTDLLRPDPRKCSHVQYESGAATHRVYGSICSKWVRLGGDRRFGAPTTDELPSAHGRVSHFMGGSIYWSRSTHAHEVHGSIGLTYREAGADASCLGLPVHDEERFDGGRVSRFEHGVIQWNGGPRGQVLCTPSG
jgi:LGFP repeat